MITSVLTQLRKVTVRCTFVSVWDSAGEIRTRAIYHTDDQSIEVLESVDVEDPGSLIREYIVLPDGSTRPVCRSCHDYVPIIIGQASAQGHSVEALQCPFCHHVQHPIPR